MEFYRSGTFCEKLKEIWLLEEDLCFVESFISIDNLKALDPTIILPCDSEFGSYGQ